MSRIDQPTDRGPISCLELGDGSWGVMAKGYGVSLGRGLMTMF